VITQGDNSFEISAPTLSRKRSQTPIAMKLS